MKPLLIVLVPETSKPDSLLKRLRLLEFRVRRMTYAQAREDIGKTAPALLIAVLSGKRDKTVADSLSRRWGIPVLYDPGKSPSVVFRCDPSRVVPARQPALEKTLRAAMAGVSSTRQRKAAPSRGGRRRRPVRPEKTGDANIPFDEEKYRIVADNTYDWEFWLAPDGRFHYVSPSCHRITGYSREEFQQDRRLLKNIIHPADLPAYETHEAHVLTSRRNSEIQFRIHSRSGDVRWISHVCQPVFSPDGLYLGVRGSNRDITNEKAAEEALAESEKRFRTLMEDASDGIFTSDESGNCTDINRSGCQLVGFARQEMLSMNVRDLIHPQDRKEHEGQWTELLRGKSFFRSLRLRKKDGSYFVGEINAKRLPDGRVQGIVRDITERKRAEKQLLISQSSYEGIINSITEAVYIQDENGAFIDVNTAAVNMYGYPREYFIGRTPEFVSAPGKNDLPLVAEMVARALEGVPQHFEFWGLRKNGSVFPKAISLTPGTYFGQKVVIAVARDITERKQVEEQLRASEEKYRTLAETSRDIVVLYDLDGNLLYANPATSRVLGYSAGDIPHVNLNRIIAPEHAAEVNARHSLRVRGDLSMRQYEIELITKNGERIPFEINTSVANSSGKPLFVSVARDLRERRKTEARVKEQLAFARALNRLLEAIMTAEADRTDMLAVMVEAIGEALNVDRCLIFDVNHATQEIRSLSKWMGEGIADFSPGMETYPMELFVSSADSLFRTRSPILSHRDDRNELLVLEGSASLLHDRMGVESLLWFPFGFRPDGHYLLVFNQMKERRSWRPEELDFVDSVSKQVSIALMKARLVAERGEAEEQLRQAEEQYRGIFEHVTEGVFQSTRDGRFLVANPALAKILGYPSSEELIASITEINRQLYVVPERRLEFQRILDQKGQVLEFESEVYRKDGSRIWISENIRLVTHPTGTPAYFEGTVTDITDRKIVERKLIETLKEFETLIEGIPDGVFFKDGDGRWLITNAPAKKLFRLDGVDWYGKTDRELASLQPQLAHAYDQCISLDEAAWRNGQKTVGLEIIADESGNNHYLEVTKMPLFDDAGGRLGLVIIGRDVTLQRESQETIKEQEILLDNAKDAIVVSDLDYHVLYWNQSAEKMYGWSRAEAVGKNLMTLLSPESKKAADTLADVVRNNGWADEVVHRTRSGREILVESRQSLIRDSSGNPKSALHINTDITEKKRMEQQFLRAQRMESIGRMSSGIAHDLNNILTPILMSVQIFKEKIPDPQLQKLIPLLESNVQRGADLMKKLLMFSRGVEGQYVRVDLKRVLSEIENITRSTFSKNISVATRTAHNLWRVRGDVTQLHQIFLNLCVNSRDAMPNGGQLTMEAENVILRAGYVYRDQEIKPGHYVVVRVSDTGTGIPAELMDRIFEPFFSTKEIESGTGLGLSTVAALVKAHQGVVAVQSEIGRGTTFKVHLPAMEDSFDDSGEIEDSALKKGNGEWILVVDDEPPIRKILTNILESHNYKVIVAQDGREAIDLFHAHRNEIRVVITDMSMPRLDGPALIRELRTHRPDLRIIAMSGLPDSHRHVEDGSIDAFLMKPYQADAVLQLLSDILR